MESFILSFLLLHFGLVSVRLDDMREYMELDKFMLDTDLVDRVWGSSVFGEEMGLIQLMIERNFEVGHGMFFGGFLQLGWLYLVG